jgi:hypothetical protein
VSDCCIFCVGALTIVSIGLDPYVFWCGLFYPAYFIILYGSVGFVELHVCIFVGVKFCLLGVYEFYIIRTVHFRHGRTKTN